MIVEVFVDFLALSLFIIFDFDVTLLELLVLSVVFSSNLLVLLADDVGLVATVLILQSLLVVELFINLSFNCGCIDLSQQGHQPVIEEIVNGVTTLLERHFWGYARAFLELGYSCNDFPDKYRIELATGRRQIFIHLLIGTFEELCVAAGTLTFFATLLLWSDVIADSALSALGGIGRVRSQLGHGLL